MFVAANSTPKSGRRLGKEQGHGVSVLVLLLVPSGGRGRGSCRIPRDGVTCRACFEAGTRTDNDKGEEEYETAMLDNLTPLIKQSTGGAGQGRAKWMQCTVKRCQLPIADCRFQGGSRWAVAKFTPAKRDRVVTPATAPPDHIPGLVRGAQGSGSAQKKPASSAMWVATGRT